MSNKQQLNSIINTVSKNITTISNDIKKQAQHKIDFKTKPLGSLGKLENIAIKMSTIQETLSPKINKKAMFIFAADHGIAEEGVSAFPQEVTKQMVSNFLANGAAINVLSKHNNIDLSIINMGVKGSIENSASLIDMKVADGTKNFTQQRAMTHEQAKQAISNGIQVFNNNYQTKKIDIVGLGEMGIGNTTSATAIISTITGHSVSECAGRGTGIDDKRFNHKIKVIEKALLYHKPNANDALDVLTKVGGLEIAGMVGAALAAASKKCAIVLDGIISTVAGLIAYTINPDIANYYIAGHKSVEKGHIFALQHMNIEPVLDLGLRLGEGTGAALTINLVDASCKIICEMASFEEAGVSNNA